MALELATRYRRLLASLSDQFDAQGNHPAQRVVHKWLHALDRLADSQWSLDNLKGHAHQVARTAPALAILHQERIARTMPSEQEDILQLTLDDLIAEASRLSAQIEDAKQIKDDGGLKQIIGKHLLSVQFHPCHSIDLNFELGELSIYENCTIETRVQIFSRQDNGFRDVLCALMHESIHVDSVEETEGDSLRIAFSEKTVLGIPLSPRAAASFEAVTFSSRAGG
ncbi:hypothetical protein, partial [Silvibacterium sp.]|uniref:hypothetical protein n=1 Tax=Silvibacterium sp. TaxID=1964179 RepID=UPI0039E4F509